MLGDFLLKKAIQQIPGDLTLEEMDKLVTMVEKYPDLFMKLAKEFKDKVTAGKSQEDAAAEVINSHGIELRALDA